MPWSEYLRRWSPEDRAKVQAVILEEALICGRCGTAPWMWDGIDAYQAIVDECNGCKHLDMQEDQMRQPNTPKRPGQRVRLVTRDTAVRMVAGARKGKRPKSPRELARERAAQA